MQLYKHPATGLYYVKRSDGFYLATINDPNSRYRNHPIMSKSGMKKGFVALDDDQTFALWNKISRR